MNGNITKIIDQYLSGELSKEDTKAFEERLETSEKLRQEVELQKSIIEGAKRAGQRQIIKRIAKNYHFNRLLKLIGLPLLVIASTLAVFIYLKSTSNQKDEKQSPSITPLTEEMISALDQRKAFDDLHSQYYQIPQKGNIILSEDGVLISVPEGAFMKNGQPYKKPVIIQFQEAITPGDIIRGGLSTVSGDQLLETQGMIGVQGFTQDGTPLEFNPEVGVYVQIPMDGYKPNMQLFDGVKLADGRIDWQSPEKLEKIPVPVDMNKLDFYPVGYEDKLDEFKWKRNKESRDSLYLSMEECTPTQSKGQQLFDSKCAACHQIRMGGTAPTLFNVREKWRKGGAKPESIYNWVRDYEKASIEDQYARSIISSKPTAMNRFPELTNEEIDWIFDYIDTHPNDDEYLVFNEQNFYITAYGKVPSRKITAEENNYLYKKKRPIEYSMSTEEAYLLSKWKEGPNWEKDFKHFVRDTIFYLRDTIDHLDYYSISDSLGNNNYISPSKVLSFWRKEFNHTNLSTREFERRMRSIHSTCNDEVLEMYVHNLDRTISEIDHEVAQMGYSDFEKFAAENVGVVNLKNPHIKLLQKFYETGIQNLKTQNFNAQKAESDRRTKLDKAIRQERSKEVKRSVSREATAFNEEFSYNLKNVYKQLGMVNAFTIRRGSITKTEENTEKIIRSNAAIKNIDAIVANATSKRQSTTIKDQKNGRTAEIKYNDFSFTVPNSNNYNKLFAYILPHELRSYQRINGKNGRFKYSLNNDILYDVAIVGLTNKGYKYYQKKNIRSGELGTISMETASEAELEASIQQLNKMRNSNPLDMREELNWLIKERAYYKELQFRKSMDKFRNTIAQTIFPCFQPWSENSSFEGETLEEAFGI